jgi:hypothetical protein
MQSHACVPLSTEHFLLRATRNTKRPPERVHCSKHAQTTVDIIGSLHSTANITTVAAINMLIQVGLHLLLHQEDEEPC